MTGPALPAPLPQGKTMKRLRYVSAGILIAVLALATAPSGADDGNFASAVTGGKTHLSLRYRYEFVNQDSFEENADASTLRLRLNYETGAWNAWTGFIEFDYVFEVLLDNFNSTSGTSSPDRDQYPVVADPDGEDLNQLYFQYSPGDNWRARFGRQRILLDDQRFVGGVGWRQNEQTYDGLSVNYAGPGKASIFYSYVGNVNRIFSDEVSAGDHRQDTHLLNAAFMLSDAWKLVGYAYVIDNEDAPAFSTSTYGLRVSGDIGAGDGKVGVLAEFASQSDNADNPASFDADYFRVQATWSMDALTLGAGIESLGSDNGQGFRTPLATLHAFNGWADQFLATPAGGLDDVYVKLGFKPGKWNLQFVYHDFSADTGGSSYGSEFDFSAGRKLGEKYGLLLKLAAFEADDAPFVDTTKGWLMLTAAW